MEQQKKVWQRLDAKGCITIATEINELFADGWEISLSPKIKEFPSFLNGVRMTFIRQDEEAVDEVVAEKAAVVAKEATETAVQAASELGVDLSRVEGTGKDGKVTKPDVVAFSEANA